MKIPFVIRKNTSTGDIVRSNNSHVVSLIKIWIQFSSIAKSWLDKVHKKFIK